MPDVGADHPNTFSPMVFDDGMVGYLAESIYEIHRHSPEPGST